MKCDNCGRKYLVSDAEREFETFFDGLWYSTEIDGHLCADCAIEYMKDVMRSQEGWEEVYGEDDPW